MHKYFHLFLIFLAAALQNHSGWCKKGKGLMNIRLALSVCGAYKKNIQGKIENKEGLKDKGSQCYKWNQCDNCPRFSLASCAERILTRDHGKYNDIKKPNFVVRLIEKLLNPNGWQGEYHNTLGIIYNENYVLTAAHVVYGFPPEGLTVIAGDYRRNETEETEQIRRVTQIIMHEGYDPRKDILKDDLALLKLDTSLVLTADVGIAVIEDFPEIETQLTMGFWGSILGVVLPPENTFGSLIGFRKSKEKCITQRPTLGENNVCGNGEGDDFTCFSDDTVLFLKADGKAVMGIMTSRSNCIPFNQPYHVFLNITSYTGWLVSKTSTRVSKTRKHH